MCSAYWGVMRGDNTYSMYMQHLRYEVGSADRDNILQFLIPVLCVQYVYSVVAIGCVTDSAGMNCVV